MFHRRLLLLAGAMALCAAPLAGQLARLTLAQGDTLRAESERKLERSSWTPTRRGRILDRYGRVVAADRPSYDIAVEYEVITGEWAMRRAGRYARRAHREAWPKLSAMERDGLIARYLPAYEAHLDQAWASFAEMGGVSAEELTERRERVVASVRRTYERVVERRRERAVEEQLSRGREITAEIEERIDELAERPIREQTGLHVLAPRVPDEVSFRFQRLASQRVALAPGGAGEPTDEVERIPGLRVLDARDRLYPLDTQRVALDPSTFPSPLRSRGPLVIDVAGVGAHVVGWLGTEATAEDIERRREVLAVDADLRARSVTPGGLDRGSYRPGDLVGRGGIERSQEDTLRGLRGLRTTRLDTAETVTLDPVPGGDVHLTLDIALQARIQALMTPAVGLARVQAFHTGPGASANPTMPEGTPINGAAVVLEIDTGEILAMVSMPGIDREVLANDPMALFGDDLNTPTINRCVSVPYQPGSVVKALMVPAARALGRLAPGERIICTGHFLANLEDAYRCWIYKRFGATHAGATGAGLDAREAIKVSCNIYFYELGRRLGAEGLRSAFGWFGLGEGFGLGVGPEFEGSIGDLRTGRLEPQDQILMGIGQGPVAWTPLHAAESLSILARAGVHLRPTLVMGAATMGDARELDLPRAAVEDALEGLRLSVNDPEGTGHHISFVGGVREPIFNAPGVDVWGKTGTATAADLRVDLDGDGVRDVARRGDHSWFVVLVGPAGAGPKYTIAVVMEYAGSGGRVSGPIANQIVHALVAEGYLP